jgi:hypothetical protein
MTNPENRREDRFVVRIWRESAASANWRASVSHLGSREIRYFTEYGDLCDFLDRWAEPERRPD